MREDFKKVIGTEVFDFGQNSKAEQTLNRHSGKQSIPASWAIVSAQEGNSLDKISANAHYIAPFFKTAKGHEVGLTQYFYVKLRNVSDVGKLEGMAEQNNVQIVGSNRFMPLWYTLACSKESFGNALELANKFYESDMFGAAEPDFLTEPDLHCVTDPLFSSQWNLSNTNWCEARSVSTGCSSVIVAVLDEGIELNHPDFANISSTSFDTESGTSPSQVRGSHGTACAGIIGATNNNVGIAGIAPNITLMSISNSFAATPNSRQARADGINFAWQHGASIISNSWSSTVQYQIIDDAIQNAVTLGRNGLGTIIFFSTGNNNSSTIEYPSNNANVIAVGATNTSNGRASYSNYGSGLDLVAPGDNIYTTDRQGTAGYNTASGTSGNYTSTFNGTSAACPQAAAAMALILSVNPNLTLAQARAVLETTTDKHTGYTFNSNVSGQPNGTWNNNLGYGKINIGRALRSLFTASGPEKICSNNTAYSLTTAPPATTVTWTASSNLTPTSGSGLTATLSPNGLGAGWIEWSFFSSSCGSSLVKFKRQIFVKDYIEGTYTKSGSTYPVNTTNGVASGVTVVALNYPGMTGYNMTKTSGNPNSYFIYNSNRNVDINMSSGQSVAFQVSASGSCGQGSSRNIAFYVSGFFAFTLSPNPATETLTVSAQSVSEDTKTEDISFGSSKNEKTIPSGDLNKVVVKLFNSSQKTVREGKFVNGMLELDVRSLERGQYYLNIIGGDGTKFLQEHLVLQ